MKKRATPITLQTLCHRCNRAAGQLLKIQEMVRDKRAPEDILNMLLAIEGSVSSMIYEHFIVIIREHLANTVRELSQGENLDPALQNIIDKMMKKTPSDFIKQLPKVFYDLKEFKRSRAS